MPLIACGVQWLLWDALIKPYVWFLFFPAVFFSAWLGGLKGGLVATLLSALLVLYFFIPPQFSFTIASASSAASILLFIMMGGLFAWTFERLEQAMRRTGEALAQTRAANKTISTLYEKTRELDRLKSQFFANISHELRTPLTLIMAPLEQRLREPPDGDFPERTRRENEMMLRNARLLHRCVSDLLDAAKIESGGMTVEWARLDLASIARTIASHFESHAQQRGIVYTINVPERLPMQGDAEKLQRILLNLLGNAFKFTGDGGSIELRLMRTAGHAFIEVRDNGPGVPADRREAIFERFRQLDGGISRRQGGTGLGLSIVKDFAEMHGGGVEIGDAPGGGSVFTVRLPLKAPPGARLSDATNRDAFLEPLPPSDPPQSLPLATTEAGADAPLVLVVEDNRDMREFITGILRPYFRVAGARDGLEGFEQAVRQTPALILTDLMMPNMDGGELTAALRGRADLRDIPVMLLTAKADDAFRVQLLKAGVRDYIQKPFNPEELLARVRGLVAERLDRIAELRAGEMRFEAIFEQAAVGIVQMAPDGRFLRVNRRICEILGYSAGELLSKTFREITAAEDLPASMAQLHGMLNGEYASFSLEKRYLRADGRTIWGNVSASVVRGADGEPSYLIAVIEDISRRKFAEQSLHRAESWFKAVIDSSDDAIVGKDLDGFVISWNPGAERVFGYTAAEMVGRPITVLLPGDKVKEEEMLLNRIRRGEHVLHYQAERIRKDGQRIFVSISISPIHDETGRIIGAAKIARDITERVRAEEQLRCTIQILELFNAASVDREIQMIALKRQVNELSQRLGRASPYDLAFANDRQPVLPESGQQ